MSTWPRWKYEHDCRQCLYQGSGINDGQQLDFYYCPSPSGGSAIARYGDDGPEYWSMPVSMLQEAADRGSTYASMAIHSLNAAIRQAKGETT